MQITDKQIKEFQEIHKKEYGEDISKEEAYESAHNLLGFVKTLYDIDLKDKQRQLKLKKHPKGFHIEGNGYSCFICGNSISNEETWYDKWGIKCLTCQKAIDKKVIPASIAKNKDSWYSKYDLESRFNINHHAIKSFIKEGILKPRIIRHDSNRPHVYLFLIKDNKDTLPPKKLTESQTVKEVKKDGEEWFHSEPWYRFVDPFEHLKEYKIINYLKFNNKK
jgi:hypothetical protein